jgi:hypothetical protein
MKTHVASICLLHAGVLPGLYLYIENVAASSSDTLIGFHRTVQRYIPVERTLHYGKLLGCTSEREQENSTSRNVAIGPSNDK